MQQEASWPTITVFESDLAEAQHHSCDSEGCDFKSISNALFREYQVSQFAFSAGRDRSHWHDLTEYSVFFSIPGQYLSSV